MGKLVIHQSGKLEGEIKIGGAKNAVLPIMVAALLTDQCCSVCDVPKVVDVTHMRNLLICLGASVLPNPGEGYFITAKKIQNDVASYEMVNKLRASFLVAGPLLARTGRVKIGLPGGCQIGARPVDLHIKGFAAMGARIRQNHGFMEMSCRHLKGDRIYLDFPSVGATENLMMAAVLADGVTTIANAAVEPEIVDLATFLNSMGAEVRGAGTDTVKINGVKSLRGAVHSTIPDRIEAGTFMLAAAVTHSKLRINNVLPTHLKPVTAKLNEMGIEVTEGDNYILVDGSERYRAADVNTMPHPGFPTDMQQPFSALLCLAEGTSVVTESVFENRFMQVPELIRMGAAIKTAGKSIVIEGKKRLSGAKLTATDLRAGGALVLAALAAEGETEISGLCHIDRGYDAIDQKLRGVGADIQRLDD